MSGEKKPKSDQDRIRELEAQVEKLQAAMNVSFGGPNFVVYGTKESIVELQRRLGLVS